MRTLEVSLPAGHYVFAMPGKGNNDHLYSADIGVFNSDDDCIYGHSVYFDSEKEYDAYLEGMIDMSYNMGLSYHVSQDYPDDGEDKAKE